MPQPERDHRAIDTYLRQFRGRTALEPACRRRIVFANSKNALVLSSSPPPSRGAGRRHRTMPHARIASPLKSRPKRQSLGIFRDSAFWRKCRIRHFRHRFAIKTLLSWYREGNNVEQQLPILSTYLGHTCVRDTYWYLSACPELMEQAVRRLDRRWEAKP